MSGQFIEDVGQHGGEAIEGLNGGVALTSNEKLGATGSASVFVRFWIAP